MDATLQADHLAFPVRDVEASRRFYGEFLGLPLIQALSGDDWNGFPWLMMIYALADGRQFALCAFDGAPAPPASGLPAEARHVALAVSSWDELADWKRRLEAAGLSFTAEDHGTQRSLYFADPSGNVLELTAPPTPRSSTVDPRAAEIVARWLAARS